MNFLVDYAVVEKKNQLKTVVNACLYYDSPIGVFSTDGSSMKTMNMIYQLGYQVTLTVTR